MNIGTLTGYLELVDNGTPALKKFESTLSSVGGSMTKAGMALSAGITVPLAALAGGAATAAIQFESSFAGVRKTVNATAPELEQLKSAFRGMAKEIPISVNELNRIAEAGGQLGVKTQDIEGFTRTMADMGIATNLSSDQAATGLAQIANIINNQAGPQYAKLGATIVDLGNKSAATESDIVEFGLRLAGAGKVAGLSEPEILGIGTALASVGINAEAGGTAFSKVIINIASAAASGGKDLEGFAAVAGVSAADFKKAFETDAAGAVVSFVEGLGRIDKEGGNLFGTLEKLGVTEQRMRDALLRSAGAGDLLRESIANGNIAWEKGNALTNEASIRYQTTASQLTILKNQVYDVAITLGNALLPTLRSGVNLLKDYVPVLERVAKGFGDLPRVAQMVILGLGAILAIGGPLLILLGQMAIAWAALVPLWTATGVVLTSMLFPFKLLISQIEIFGVVTGTSTTATYLFNTALKTLAASPLVIVGLVIALGAAFVQFGEGLRKAGETWRNNGSMWDFFTKKEDDNFIRRALGWSKSIDGVTESLKQMAPWVGALDKFDLPKVSDNEQANSAARIAALQSDEQIKAAQKTADHLNEILATNIKEAQGIKAASWAWEAAQLDFNGERALRLVEQSYKDQQEALHTNLQVESSMREAAWASQSAELNKQGTDAIALATKHYNEIGQYSRSALQVQANESRRIYEEMASHPADYSKSTLAHFKKIADGAQRTADGIRSAFDKTYDTLGHIATILDNVSGKFAEAGAVAARTGQAMMKAFATGDWIGGIVAGVTGAITIIGKLFTGISEEVKKARSDLDNFNSSLAETATTSQLAEAGGEAWKLTIIQVRDAYLATGRTAEEALEAVAELWNTDNPAASAAAIREVTSVLAEYKAQAEGVTNATAALNEGTAQGITNQADYNRAATASVLLFDDMVRRTGDVAGALAALEPTLNQLAIGENELGLQGNAAITQLLGFRDIIKTHEGLFAAINMNIGVMKGLGQAGLLTRDNIVAFGQDAVNHLAILTGETGNVKEAMVLMQPELQVLWEQQQKLGHFADAATEAMVNQAREQGLVGPEMRSTNEQLLEVMKDIRDVIAEATGHTRDFGDAINDLPTEHHTRFVVDQDEAPHAAGGLYVPRGSDTIPAMIGPNERVLTSAQTQAYNNSQQPSNGDVVDAIDGLSNTLTNKMARSLARALGTELVGLRTAS